MFTKRSTVATDAPGTRGVLNGTNAIIAKVDDPESLLNALLKGFVQLGSRRENSRGRIRTSNRQH